MIHTLTTAIPAIGTQIIGIGTVAIVSLVFLSILRDLSIVELKDRMLNNNKYPSIMGLLVKAKKIREEENGGLSLFANSSNAFIIPLFYIFLSIILYKIIIVM